MPSTSQSGKTNRVGLSKKDYRGLPSTLCPGCGHNSITSQIVDACFEMDIVPEKIMRFSGIGCSSKSLAYFLDRSFGFNGLHGRMPSLVTGAMFGDASLEAIGISGDGDTASIGLGQFIHLVRRNVPLLYIIENNGVYGLTKGQFSATAEKDLSLKHHGTNPYMPIDLCMIALVAKASFVARSFAGDPRQVRSLIKAGLAHHGTAILDVISPCVTFNNQENAFHSYSWGKDHSAPLHEIDFVPAREEIALDRFEPGTRREVILHDGSTIILKKLAEDYDPSDRKQALQVLEEAEANDWLLTGLIYIETGKPTILENYNLPNTALNRLTEVDLRPDPATLVAINTTLSNK